MLLNVFFNKYKKLYTRGVDSIQIPDILHCEIAN